MNFENKCKLNVNNEQKNWSCFTSMHEYRYMAQFINSNSRNFLDEIFY